MTIHRNTKRAILSLAVWAAFAGIGGVRPASAQNAAPQQAAEAPPIVEWVYQVKWGYFDDFYAIFKKYQIAILDEEKKEGLVTKYIVQRGGGHVAESERWDLRVLVYYKDKDAQAKGRAVAQKLFPDQAAFRKEELERWRLTTEHWDRPLTEVDPHVETARN